MSIWILFRGNKCKPHDPTARLGSVPSFQFFLPARSSNESNRAFLHLLWYPEVIITPGLLLFSDYFIGLAFFWSETSVLAVQTEEGEEWESSRDLVRWGPVLLVLGLIIQISLFRVPYPCLKRSFFNTGVSQQFPFQ